MGMYLSFTRTIVFCECLIKETPMAARWGLGGEIF